MKTNTRNFDAIVIGSGIGGLVTASQLSAKGAKVLVLEKYIIPGGSGGSFKRRGYTFDVGASMIFGFGDKGYTNLLTRALKDVNEKCETIPDPVQLEYHLPHNLNISVSKKDISNIINSETFLSKVIQLDIDGKKEKVIPRDITYHVVSEEPLHIDFMRIVSGKKIIIEIPVKFINHSDSPGLKRGGVLNIVRRQVELRCPAENIPTELIVDLEGLDLSLIHI